jgi:hypothetical protein
LKLILNLKIMRNSKNWEAKAIPAFGGGKTELEVSGEVGSGIIGPELRASNSKEKLPENVYGLELLRDSGGPASKVIYKTDITGQDQLQIVLVFGREGGIEAAIPINRGILS